MTCNTALRAIHLIGRDNGSDVIVASASLNASGFALIGAFFPTPDRTVFSSLAQKRFKTGWRQMRRLLILSRRIKPRV
jgi:hypothetical protein